jgi:D-apiose dehydrogenase
MGEMWLEGSNGVMRLDGDARLWWAPHQGAEALHAYDSGPASGFGGGACGALQRHVVQGLAHQTRIENTAQDYLQNLLIQEAVYASHASGRRVEMAAFTPGLTHPPVPAFSV